MARILLVDDEEPVRGFLKRGLELDGHTVATAIDGGDGLDRLAERDDCFDLLLTDIRMPMMDGIALAHAAKREHPNLVILLMTGFADQRERAEDLSQVIRDVVTKPFTLQQIRRALPPLIGLLKGQFGMIADQIAALNLIASRGSNEQTRLRVLREGVGSARIAIDIAMVRVKENHTVDEADESGEATKSEAV